MSNTYIVIDSSKVPKTSQADLRDGATLSLEDAPDLKCLVGFVVVSPTYVASSCRICNVIYIERTYETAEAKIVQHLRRQHSIYAPLWQYTEDLVVHPIS